MNMTRSLETDELEYYEVINPKIIEDGFYLYNIKAEYIGECFATVGLEVNDNFNDCIILKKLDKL